LVLLSSGDLVEAGSVQVGQLLAWGWQSEMCKVIAIEAENSPQLYFGLNCAESMVLAEGIRCSTFGKLHRLPALFMSWISHLVGVHKASAIGDGVAQTFRKLLG